MMPFSAWARVGLTLMTFSLRRTVALALLILDIKPGGPARQNQFYVKLPHRRLVQVTLDRRNCSLSARPKYSASLDRPSSRINTLSLAVNQTRALQ